MHPTPTEQLQAIRFLIEQARADREQSAASQQLLADATRLLRRLERSWPKRMPFLVDDNRRALRLLSELRPHLAPLDAEIAEVDRRPATDSEESAHKRNVELQGLLGRAVHLLPDDSDGDRGRAKITQHLRQRTAADPALNRDPAERPPLDP